MSLAVPAAPARARRKLAFSDLAVRIIAGIVILLVWEVVVRLWAPPFVARPSAIVQVAPAVLANATFWQAAAATLGAVFKGLAIAFVIGTVLGVGIGRIRAVDRMTSIYISGLFAMPLTAILPLASLWFGYTADARLAIVVFASFFSIVLNVSDGARAVPPEYIEVSRSFRGSAVSRLVDVILPSSVPYILAGLRLAAGRALIAAVVAEFFVSIPGLGFYILFQARTFHHNEAFVAVALLACAGVLFEIALRQATARWLPWYRRGEPVG
ncbi:MAG TPA: ABC transporter permease [Xanthobacteraceae bacterium]|nr:ABC transporter permease [Xanthobacteraceae bacterium]